LLLFLSGSCY